jgi:hypothetical protein
MSLAKPGIDWSNVAGRRQMWRTKTAGKTVTRRLSPTEAKLYSEWIANDRKMRQLITQMRQVAAKAHEIRLAEATGT